MLTNLPDLHEQMLQMFWYCHLPWDTQWIGYTSEGGSSYLETFTSFHCWSTGTFKEKNLLPEGVVKTGNGMWIVKQIHLDVLVLLHKE